MFYLDYNASAPLRSNVCNGLKLLLEDLKGNPSSIHKAGRSARRYVETARATVAKVLNVDEKRIVFTSGATEANALVLTNFKGRVLISAIEHDSVLRQKPEATRIPVTEKGIINLEALEALLYQDTPTLVSVMAANNETGIIQPIDEIVKLCKKYKALFHCDASQAIGRMSLPWASMNMLSLSAHKFGGPSGAGALIIDPAFPPLPLIKGGGQERSYRAGSENILGIVGLGVAIESSQQDDWSYACHLRDQFESQLLKDHPEATVIGKDSLRLPNVSLVSMPGVSSQTQVMAFDLAGFCVSAGAACSSGKVKTSHVLTAMGVDAGIRNGAIRVSLCPDTTAHEMNGFLSQWKSVYTKNNTVAEVAHVSF